MTLTIKSVTLDDFSLFEKYASPTDDLTAPLVPLGWHLDEHDKEGALARARWSLKQQHEIFTDDPTVRFLKVVDSATSDTVALARWHFYSHGFDPSTMSAWELNGRAPDADERWPPGMNVPLAKAVLLPLLKARPTWMTHGPQWVLTTLVTRETARRRGAGGMLVDWGVEMAKRDGVPAYLEATAAGAPLYAKHGFKVLGEQIVDLNDYGASLLTLKRMGANMPA